MANKGKKCPSHVDTLGDVKVDSLNIGGVAVTGAGGLTLVGVTASAAEINKLTGSGAVVASGTQHAHVADVAVTTIRSDTAAHTAADCQTYLDALRTGQLAVLAALEAFGINASA